jgi:hypothetical protein
MILNPSVAKITTVGNAAITAAQLFTTNILRSGPVGAFTDTIDTASNIAAALGTPGGSFEVLYVNNSGSAATLAAGVGVTLSGASAVIPANTLTTLLVQVVSASSVTVTVLARATAT